MVVPWFTGATTCRSQEAQRAESELNLLKPRLADVECPAQWGGGVRELLGEGRWRISLGRLPKYWLFTAHDMTRMHGLHSLPFVAAFPDVSAHV